MNKNYNEFNLKLDNIIRNYKLDEFINIENFIKDINSSFLNEEDEEIEPKLITLILNGYVKMNILEINYGVYCPCNKNKEIFSDFLSIPSTYICNKCNYEMDREFLFKNAFVLYKKVNELKPPKIQVEIPLPTSCGDCPFSLTSKFAYHGEFNLQLKCSQGYISTQDISENLLNSKRCEGCKLEEFIVNY